MKVFLVIPTVRDLSFLNEWGERLKDCHIVIVEDRTIKNVRVPKKQYQSISHYSWEDIARDFGSNEWIFSRKNAGIRCYGFWKAYEAGADIIVTIDDDCYPTDDPFVETHIANLSLKAPGGWVPTYPHRDFVFTRGIPYSVRGKYPVVVSHGLWTNKIDLDAKTQLRHPDIDLPAYPSVLTFVPRGYFFPMCSMNLAFRREVTPLMYFPLMGEDAHGQRWGYDRFDDIWAGIFAKKILDHLGLSVANGSPFVEHRKASDAQKNLQKERRGTAVNEDLWRRVSEVKFTQATIVGCYRELAQKIAFPSIPYFTKLRQAMVLWANLFV
jgi:hypothetical protein